MLICLATILLLHSALTSAQEDTQLQLLQIVFRHGDRSPVIIYPNDPYNASYWDKYGGLGQLTQTGMEQHYEYGQFLRDRYKDFLSKYYDKSQVYVRSTDYDRTQMSVASMLSSLYKPEDYQEWNKNVSWQPIPIHTNDADTIFSNTDKCERYAQLKYEVIETAEYKNLTKKYQDLIDLAVKEAGFKSMTLMDMWMLSDDIYVQKSHNLTLSKWITDNLDRFMELRDIDFFLDFRTTEMAKLASGGVLNEITKNIVKKSKTPTNPNQLFLFSSHDTYVAGMTKLLNLTLNIKQPNYASAIIMELRKSTKSDNYFVQVYMKNNEANEPIVFTPMTIYGCDQLCPLETYLKIVQDKVVTDFPSVCKKEQPSVSLANVTLIVSFSFVALIGLFLIAFAIRSCRRSMNESAAYERQIL